MKKKIVAFMLVISMMAIALIGGTLAYFTDFDAATNVMTMGNVDIEQIELERGPEGSLIPFTQDKFVFPAVGEAKWEDEAIEVGGGVQKVFDVENVIDKFVYVKNTGANDVYVRTIVAIEAPNYDRNNLIHVNINNTDGVTMTDWAAVEINGVQYVYSVFTYTKALAPNAETPVSLAQVYLDPVTTQKDAAAYNGQWTILCLSQGVQEAGFPDAATALNEAFGEANATNVEDWLK